MIDPATGWFEMAQITNKTAAEIADITEKTWFTRSPLPQRIVFDCGTEFMAEFSKMCHNDYGLKRKPIAKTTDQKYGKLPPKQAETNPWDTLCVDLIGPYTIPRKGKTRLNCGA